jgi:hypothetical protein
MSSTSTGGRTLDSCTVRNPSIRSPIAPRHSHTVLIPPSDACPADLQLMHTLQWPSLTVQWLPGRQRDPDDNFSTQQCLLGTHTSGTDTDYVIIAGAWLDVCSGHRLRAAVPFDNSGRGREHPACRYA